MLKKYLKALSKQASTLSFTSGADGVRMDVQAGTEVTVVSPCNGVVKFAVEGLTTSSWFRLYTGGGEFIYNNESNYKRATLPVKKGGVVICHSGTSPTAYLVFSPCEADR